MHNHLMRQKFFRMKLSHFDTSWKRDDGMVWLDPKHEGCELLCEEQESRKTVLKEVEETLAAESAHLTVRGLGPIIIDK